MSNLAEILTTTAGRYGDRTAIKLDTTEYAYRELDRAASAAADLIPGTAVSPGDRVGLMRAISVSQLAAGVDAGAR